MTTFQIVEKPLRTSMTVDGSEVVVGTKYDIALESSVVIENETPYLGEPFDSFKYKIYKDDIASVNIGTVKLSFPTEKIGLPPIETLVKNIELFEEFFFTDIAVYDIHYDRIIISAIAGRGSWLLNGAPISVGQTIFYYDLVNNLKFIADDPGCMDNYSVLTWDTANILGPDNQANTISVNVSSDGAEIILLSASIDPIIEEGSLVESFNYTFKIQRSIVDAPFEIEVDTTLFPSIGTDPESKVILTNEIPEVVTINTLGVQAITSTLNNNGEINYSVVISKEAVTVTANSVKITITEVDTDSLNVNPLLKEIILIIPQTLTP